VHHVTQDEGITAHGSNAGVGIQPEHTFENLGTETIVEEPVVHETVQERHIDEIHPVVHHNVDHHHVEHVTQPIHEEHHAAPIVDDSGLNSTQTVSGDSGIKSPFEE